MVDWGWSVVICSLFTANRIWLAISETGLYYIHFESLQMIHIYIYCIRTSRSSLTTKRITKFRHIHYRIYIVTKFVSPTTRHFQSFRFGFRCNYRAPYSSFVFGIHPRYYCICIRHNTGIRFSRHRVPLSYSNQRSATGNMVYPRERNRVKSENRHDAFTSQIVNNNIHRNCSGVCLSTAVYT